MSKTDAISGGLTLIVTAVGYFVGGPKAAAICLAGGIFLLLWAHFFKRDRKPTPETRSTSNTGDVQVGDFRSGDVRTCDIHINLPPPQGPRLPAVGEEERSNVAFLGTRKVNLQHDGYQGISFREVSQETDLRGVIACFRNEGIYGQRVKQFHNIRAHLRFKDSAGVEIGTGVSGACWLGQKNDLINLETDKSACVLLMVSPRSGRIFVPWKERRLADLNSETIHDRDFELKEFPSTAEVRLVDGNKQLLLAPVVIDIGTLKQRQ